MLEALGAVRAEVEGPDLSKRIAEAGKIDAVLDLVGNSTILDSLAMLRRGGRACLAGWLGGLAPIADFNPLLQMASGVYLTFFGSFVFGKPGFPLSDVPLQAIAADVEAGRYKAKPSRVFRFEDIREAHRVMESNRGQREDGRGPVSDRPDSGRRAEFGGRPAMACDVRIAAIGRRHLRIVLFEPSTHRVAPRPHPGDACPAPND